MRIPPGLMGTNKGGGWTATAHIGRKHFSIDVSTDVDEPQPV